MAGGPGDAVMSKILSCPLQRRHMLDFFPEMPIVPWCLGKGSELTLPGRTREHFIGKSDGESGERIHRQMRSDGQ
jgi:hypothetical protein